MSGHFWLLDERLFGDNALSDAVWCCDEISTVAKARGGQGGPQTEPIPRSGTSGDPFQLDVRRIIT